MLRRSVQPPHALQHYAIEEGTPGKWSLIATHPKRFGAIVELYATTAAANVRKVALGLAGYTVAVVLSN